MAEITIKLKDNPLRGRRGQSDFTVTLLSDPPWRLPAGGGLPDPDTLSTAQAAAVHCVATLMDITYESALIHLAMGSDA